MASNNSKKILFGIFEILSLIFVRYNLVKYGKLGGKEQVPSVTGPTGGKLDSWGDFGDMEDNREAVRIIIGKEKTGGEDPRKSQKRRTKETGRYNTIHFLTFCLECARAQ